MPAETADRTRTVACRLETWIPDASVLADIRTAVERAHLATLHATHLLNLHVRRCLRDSVSLDRVFDGNWLLQAFYEVTHGTRSPHVDTELRATTQGCMPTAFERPPRTGLTNTMLHNANLLATVGANNVWMHFPRRALGYVQRQLALPREAYDSLTKDERTARKLQLLRVASDLQRAPHQPRASDAAHHPWLDVHRARLGLDAAVGAWGDKPLAYHLKARPHRFLGVMALMSSDAEARGGKAFALFPVRRALIPKHIRFCEQGFHKAMEALRNERLRRVRRPKGEDELTLENCTNPRAFSQAWRLEPGFTTDGVSVRAQQTPGSRAAVREARDARQAKKEAKAQSRKRTRDGERAQGREGESGAPRRSAAPPCTERPVRGIWHIDELKRVSRLEELHVIGVDPGKVELIVATDADAPGARPVRYTQRERRKAMRTRQYADEAQRTKPFEVSAAEEDLAGHSSRSASLDAFRAYVAERQSHLAVCLAHYADVAHRQRLWKAHIKRQQSEEQLYAKLRALRTDDRPLVLAYGAWGLVAGRPGAPCNRGNPPCIGVGLMRKLARHFVVAPTPEQFTSRTCYRCGGTCAAHDTIRTRNNREVRGLRVCQDEGCKAHLNRDANASRNIGIQFGRLFEGLPPLRQLSPQDAELQHHRVALECAQE